MATVEGRDVVVTRLTGTRCPTCGEEYLGAESVKKVEDIVKKFRKPAIVFKCKITKSGGRRVLGIPEEIGRALGKKRMWISGLRMIRWWQKCSDGNEESVGCGIFAEPSGAVSYAGRWRSVKSYPVIVVCVAMWHGLKGYDRDRLKNQFCPSAKLSWLPLQIIKNIKLYNLVGIISYNLMVAIRKKTVEDFD